MATLVPFEKRSVSTMTMIVQISDINPVSAFWLLPWKFCDNFVEAKKKKKPVDIPAGTICSIRCKIGARGMISGSKKAFQHAVTIVISIGHKLVNVKLSKNSIHICGATAERDGIIAADLLIGHLRKVQWLQSQVMHDSEKEKSLAWIEKYCKGREVVRERISSTVEMSNTVYKFIDRWDDNHINEADYDGEDPLLKFYLSFAKDYHYFQDYLRFLREINKVPLLFHSELCRLGHETVMCNYNYSLKFIVNRDAIKKVFNNHYGFRARNNKEISDHATVELPYERKESKIVKRKPNKVPRHSFIVYSTGSITQSGPGGEEAKRAYERFMDVISANLNEIRID